jgi:hypothetical protein
MFVPCANFLSLAALGIGIVVCKAALFCHVGGSPCFLLSLFKQGSYGYKRKEQLIN